jgi:uncharacterized repeat protein (TIGR01451 family)
MSSPVVLILTVVWLVPVLPVGAISPSTSEIAFAPVEAYNNDFNSSIGSEWSANAGILTTPSAERVLGSTTQFGSPDLVVNETLVLTLTGLPAHSLLDLSVDLYTVKSWDGNRTDFGPDSWDLNVTGTSSDVQPLTTFSNFVGVNQAYPDAYPGGSHPGMTGAAATGDLLGLGSSGNGEIPAARYSFNHSFAHTATSVTFNFTGSNLQHAFDEGWVLDNVVVSVTDFPPVASFTASPNPAACGQAVTFDASGSTHQDPDRSIVSYDWDFGDGATASGTVVNYSYAAFGSYTTTLTVTDDAVPPHTDTAVETISVNQGNTPPVARPGGPYSVPLGEGISLNGTASSDPDVGCGDSIVAYEWDISTDGDIDKNGPTPTVGAQEVEALGPGSHQVRLTVRDKFNLTSTATTTLTVFVNEPVASAAANPSTAGCAETIMFDGSGSYHPNPNRSIVTYAWDFGDGTTGSGATTTHTYFGQGTFTATLTVTDDNEPPRTDSATVTVTVTWPNQTPVARPGGPYAVPLGEGITLDGSASFDPNQACGDSIAAYEWDISNDGDVDHTGPTPTLTSQEVETLGTGTHQLRLTVRDEFGAQSVASTTLNVFVDEPMASFTASPNPAGCAEAITFDASSSSHPNPDRSIVSYAWDFGDGATASGMIVTHTYLTNGNLTATLTVTDDNAPPRTDTATQTITVTWPNQTPVASHGGPYTVALGHGITLDGSASSDPNEACGDQIVAYEWDIGYGGVFNVDHTGPTPTLTSQEVEALGAGTHQVALRVRDEFGATNIATTTLTVSDPPATISGDLSCNSVNGNGFAPNSSVSVVVKDAPGGATVYSNTSVPTDGTGNFNLFCGFGPDLTPGMEITVTSGPETKVLVLADLTIDVVDPPTDVVSGTAPANSSLFVGVNNPPGPGGAGQNTTADGTGNWTVDFTGVFDITGGTHANASVPDADGDNTHVNKQAPSINGNITDDFIGGEGFDPNATVTVDVRDAPGGALLFSATTPTDGGGSFGLCCGPEVGLPDLVPGMEITVSDGSRTKVLVLVALTIDAVDPPTDVISGTAPANSSLFVGVNNSSGEAGLNTTADGSGNWSVDFTGIFDIDALTQADAHVFDNDGDATSAQERPPTIHASYCCAGKISGNDFTANSSVTLEIFDSPGGTLLLSELIPTDRFGSFEFNLEATGVSLSPGMQVVASDDTSSDIKELTLDPMTLDALNPSTDTASGTAAPGTTVFVEIFAEFSPSLEVVADGSGSWVADFGAVGFDVTSAMGAIARVPDADGDTTDDEVFPPTISGNLVFDHVSGSDFTPNASVDVTIFESSGGALLFSGSVATGGEFGDFELGFDTHGVDLDPGMHIVVTDGVTSAAKELTLVSVSFDVLDPFTDTASGTAPPNAKVVLEVFDSGGEFFKETTADGTGAWTVDLGAEGFDVIEGGGNASVRDDDGDGTVADRGVPTFSATLNTDEVSGFNFTNSSTVTVEIFDSPGGTLLFSGSVPVGADSNFAVGFATHGVNLIPGQHITVTDDTTSITKGLILVAITFDVLDPVNDVASGTAPPGMRLGLEFPEGGGETAPADPNGDWFADVGAQGGDIAPSDSASICAVDSDGDCTRAEYVPEANLALTKTDPMGRQPTGRNMTYTLTVANAGPRAAYEVVATDQLPSSVTFVSATPTQGNCTRSGVTVTCSLGTIQSGNFVTINIVVKPTVAGTIINTASVTASTPDPNANNNADSESTSICRITSRRQSIPCG